MVKVGVLEQKEPFLMLPNCNDCGAKPGQTHLDGCDVERCSMCGGQAILCGPCRGHDRKFARWTGIWPGQAESVALHMDLNQFMLSGLYRLFHIKPTHVWNGDPQPKRKGK